MTVLGIETSCDETAAAVVCDGREVLSNIVYSQISMHRPYGGVVPEIASRSHLEKLPGVIVSAMATAFGKSETDPVRESWWRELDAVAVTRGPGLASSLIVGLSAAKGLAWRLNRPLIGINHIQAHIHSVFLNKGTVALTDCFPLLAMVVSGGHSVLIEMDEPLAYRIIGQTLDDASGEAFDKAAKLLGLGYPGGPVIDAVAREASGSCAPVFPRGRTQAGNPALGGLDADLCFSFSGLKTALRQYLRDNPPQSDAMVADIAAAYQEAVVDALIERCETALSHSCYKVLAVGGGVSLNSRLRERLTVTAADAEVELLLAHPRFCGDNAAMIAGLAGAGGGVKGPAAFALDVAPSLEADVHSDYRCDITAI
jgi:N6-L-threonylcarbamoyladenine synthase